jgi:SAM-dependent methyltransferase
MAGNDDQIAYWNGPTGEKWAKYQSEMDRNLADATAGLLKLAAPQPGERVLDVGCGAGETSWRIAEMVGPGGAVLGVDISQPLLAQARGRAHAKNVRFEEADASVCPFKPDYDLIFSRFGVMFFDDPAAAFANIRKAAAREARLAFVCWRPVQENEWTMLPMAAAKPLLPEQPPADPNAPGPFAFADRERTRGILAKAGFRDIAIEPFDGQMRLGTSPEHAALMLTSLMGPASRALKNVDEETRTKARDAIAKDMAAFQGSAPEIAPSTACWLVTAKA